MNRYGHEDMFHQDLSEGDFVVCNYYNSIQVMRILKFCAKTVLCTPWDKEDHLTIYHMYKKPSMLIKLRDISFLTEYEEYLKNKFKDE